MKTGATDVTEYLEALPPPRRKAVRVACDRLRAAPEIVETFDHGMPFFTFEGKQFVAVASQKHYVSIYVAGLDQTLPRTPQLEADLDGVNRGKSCLRFRDSQLDRITPDLVDELIEVTRTSWKAHDA